MSGLIPSGRETYSSFLENQTEERVASVGTFRQQTTNEIEYARDQLNYMGLFDRKSNEYDWNTATPKGEQPQAKTQPQQQESFGSKALRTGNYRLHGETEADNSNSDSSGGGGEMKDSKGDPLLSEKDANKHNWPGNTREIKGKDGKMEHQTRIPAKGGMFSKDTWIPTEQYNRQQPETSRDDSDTPAPLTSDQRKKKKAELENDLREAQQKQKKLTGNQKRGSTGDRTQAEIQRAIRYLNELEEQEKKAKDQPNIETSGDAISTPSGGARIRFKPEQPPVKSAPTTPIEPPKTKSASSERREKNNKARGSLNNQ